MGNEGSQIEIGVECIEVSSSWTLKNATSSPQVLLSVFIGQPESSPQLEIAAKKLKLYRHPGIVKYINSWSSGSSYHLATERVTPLVQVLPTLTPLQSCLGLRSILRALVFLHETAQVSHNNVCISSIYITSDNTWKLGNFEFLRGFSELNLQYLKLTRPRRYEPAISPEEDKKGAPQTVDTFAFAQLVKEVLNLKKMPGELLVTATDFLSLAGQYGELSLLLDHAYFSHPVVAILEFLSALTLKSADEKEQFFRVLWVQLATLPELMVATQLVDLLLSRLVLLEPSAQHNLLPWLLGVRPENSESGSIQSGECSPLFSKNVFEKHVAPRLVKIFQVRDSQVRSVLLRHFHSYCHAFSIQQLQHDILPELLVGIKDNDDDLVASTLRALADLVPLLGAATVIGGKRGKLFTDGRPKVRQPRVHKVTPTPSAVIKETKIVEEKITEDNTSDVEVDAQVLLPERLSPDGGEAWSDWDDQSDEPTVETPNSEAVSTNQESPKLKSTPVLADTSKAVAKKTINSDLDSLDIKMAKITVPPLQQEVDFFQDMEPVISSTSKLLLEQENVDLENITLELDSSSLLQPPQDKFKVESAEAEEGWGDEELDWGSTDEDIKLTTEVST